VGKLMQMLSEGDGQLSSMRVAMMLAMVMPLLVWTYLSLRTGTMVDMPGWVVTLQAAATAGKVAQKFAEK
jgi:hypothetical protein